MQTNNGKDEVTHDLSRSALGQPNVNGLRLIIHHMAGFHQLEDAVHISDERWADGVDWGRHCKIQGSLE